MNTTHWPVLTDYKLEKWMRGGDVSSESLNWKQLVQYAAYHAINDWYSQPPGRRTEAGLLNSLERRWSNRWRVFGSMKQSTVIQERIRHQLLRLLTESEIVSGQMPLMLFESSVVAVTSLQSNLSMIVQVMVQGDRGMIFKKYVMEDNLSINGLFLHMSSIYCQELFGCPPEQVEIVNIWDGFRTVIMPQPGSQAQSIDYLTLVKHSYFESECCKGCACGSSGVSLLQ